jgi:hypothetical protein
MAAAVSVATLSSTRPLLRWSSSMPRRSFSSLFAPKPFRSRSRPALMAPASSGTELMPSS